jgi:hypothetical protein
MCRGVVHGLRDLHALLRELIHGELAGDEARGELKTSGLHVPS